MARCDNIVITLEEKDRIIPVLSGMIFADIAPSTIVDYICAEINIPLDEPAPQVSATNWCLLTCISAAVFTTSLFTPPTSYTYVNKPYTYMRALTCFPVFPIEESGGGDGGGGGGAPPNEAEVENLEKWKDEQIHNVELELELGLEWLDDILHRAFLNLSITCASYAVWIAMLVEHMIEVTVATGVKQVGSKIKIVAETLANTADMAAAAADTAAAAVSESTEFIREGSAPPHTHATVKIFLSNVKGAWSGLRNLLTKIVQHIGDAIEQIGQFLHDAADILWDSKEIAFAFASLAAMIHQIMILIEHTFMRIEDIIDAAMHTIETIAEKYAEQIMEKLGEILMIDEFNELIEDFENQWTQFQNSVHPIVDVVEDTKILINSGPAGKLV